MININYYNGMNTKKRKRREAIKNIGWVLLLFAVYCLLICLSGPL